MNALNSAQIFAQIPQLSRPRPNGSQALAGAVLAVRSWLEERGFLVEIHPFNLRPYFMELLGLWMALLGLLLVAAASLRWGWLGLVLALALVAVPVLETRFLRPTITGLVQKPGHNLVVQLPAPRPRQEVLLCAHLDSKTELLDHAQRHILLRLGPPAMILAVLGGLLVTLERLLPPTTLCTMLHWFAVLATLLVACYGLGMGANLVGGRFLKQGSSGAVDNGAAAAVLLGLAQKLQSDLHLRHTNVTLLFTVGEEVQMQGAVAYAADRHAWPLPTSVVNTECLGQSGGYLLWEYEGTAMRQLPADRILIRALQDAVESIAAEQVLHVASSSSDAFAFLRLGIPAATLGSFDLELGERALHSALDNPQRVSAERLVQATEVLARFLIDHDAAAPVGNTDPARRIQ